MAEFRHSSRSFGGERRLEIVSGKGFGANQMYGTTRPHSPDQPPVPPRVTRMSQVSSKPWGGFSNPEMRRRKRIAQYKVYTYEGRVKASVRNGLRWIKNKCSEIIDGLVISGSVLSKYEHGLAN
ncbi:hypothetical protein RJ639_046920 [Escallonia herrerae]|uniref:DUF3511 domain protein n=1 Tax=Escallonia herrerae TaxID=1293975 RepID=A0AA88WD86_9ASTE|nr:hypothetical protein RJ639_046920 [Escallonia herrerae]